MFQHSRKKMFNVLFFKRWISNFLNLAEASQHAICYALGISSISPQIHSIWSWVIWVEDWVYFQWKAFSCSTKYLFLFCPSHRWKTGEYVRCFYQIFHFSHLQKTITVPKNQQSEDNQQGGMLWYLWYLEQKQNEMLELISQNGFK